MHLLYICANQLREIIPVDGGAFYQAARGGAFDVEVRDMVLETTAGMQHHGVRLQDLLEVVAITYPGTLQAPDSMPFEAYSDNNITVMGEWRQNATLAVFRIREICIHAHDVFSDLTLMENVLNLAPDQQFSPLVSQFYVLATEAFDCFLARHVGEGIGRLVQLENENFAEISSRMTEAKTALSLSTDSVHMDFLDALSANENLLEALIENIRVMAEGLHDLS